MPLYILLSLIFFSTPFLFAEGQIERKPQDQSKTLPVLRAGDDQVTVGEYCSFLNAVAATDPHSLYNEKMENLLRRGAPGSYLYDLITEKGNLPIDDIPQIAAMRYCNWKQATFISEGQTAQDTETTEYGIYDFQEGQVSSITPTAIFFVSTQKEKQESDFLLITNDSRYFLTQAHLQPRSDVSFIIKKPSTSPPLQIASSTPKKHPLEGDLLEAIITYTVMSLGLLLGAQLASTILTEFAIDVLSTMGSVILPSVLIGAILGLIAGRELGRMVAIWIG